MACPYRSFSASVEFKKGRVEKVRISETKMIRIELSVLANCMILRIFSPFNNAI